MIDQSRVSMSQNSPLDLSIIIPVHPQDSRLKAARTELLAFLKNFPLNWEALFVVSHGEVSQRTNDDADLPHDRVQVHYSKNSKKKGSAIAEGLGLAQGKYVFWMDIDFEVPLAEIINFLSLFESNPQIDGIIANRFDPQSQILRGYRGRRDWAAQVYRGITWEMELTPRFDCQAPFKAFRREALQKVLPLLSLKTQVWETEFLSESLRLGQHVLQRPVRWTHSPVSHFRPWRDLGLMLMEAIRYKASLLSQEARQDQDSTKG